MITFAHKGKSKRPKFLFQLKITELSNIPQSSGYCFVKWHLKDGTGTTSHSIVPSSSDSADSGSGAAAVRSSSQSRGATPRVLVKHHRAHWNYTLPKPVLVKLTTDKSRVLQRKELVLEVFFEFLERLGPGAGDRKGSQQSDASPSSGSGSSNSVYTQRVSRKVLLGVVEVNLAEYINREQRQIPSRFLLQKSKVNSILSLAIQMELARGSYEDFESSQYSNSGQLPNTLRNGISEVFDASSDASSPTSSTFTPNTASNNSAAKKTDVQGTFSITINNPFVDKLYQKTFQVPWDPRPGEFNPKECVEDILDGGDGWAKNEKGINLIDIDALHLSELEKTYEDRHRQIPMEMNHGEFDRRAFVERRVGTESRSNTLKRGVGDRKNLSRGNTPTAEDPSDNHEASYFKSWTISKILP
ncbi:LAME_0F11562g1_1 [Lachancea meyersii CBS 8951]|uniref:LAME_0F11562g1_1 n=1 Tax=Lachancea meyersii CBS 8951 TaxID=1266667 RepID=A0A1G4JW42_9SACH|nr:LAME_0F11562g1_1 [Lachancea meyersii CBS 8951]